MTGCTADRHGTLNAYRRACCRCPQARLLAARYENERTLDILRGQSRTLPNIGALRRVHALRALGWPTRELAERIGVHDRSISRWQHRSWISRELHDAICRVYDELADHPGPDERARRHAARQGWLQPLWWDADTIDDPDFDPLVAYKDVESSSVAHRATETETVADLSAKGWSARRIAEHLGCSQRQVVRLRAEIRAVELSGSESNLDDMQVAS
jgi:transcriptional regulator with XRE-family HTH domain